MSTHNMFSLRNKKNIMWIPPLICSYELMVVQNILVSISTKECYRTRRGWNTRTPITSRMRIRLNHRGRVWPACIDGDGTKHTPRMRRRRDEECQVKMRLSYRDNKGHLAL